MDGWLLQCTSEQSGLRFVSWNCVKRIAPIDVKHVSVLLLTLVVWQPLL